MGLGCNFVVYFVFACVFVCLIKRVCWVAHVIMRGCLQLEVSLWFSFCWARLWVLVCLVLCRF